MLWWLVTYKFGALVLTPDMSPNFTNKVPTFFVNIASIDYFLRHKTLNPTFLGKSDTILQLISTKEIRSDEIMKDPKPKINLIYNSYSNRS